MRNRSKRMLDDIGRQDREIRSTRHFAETNQSRIFELEKSLDLILSHLGMELQYVPATQATRKLVKKDN